MTESRKNSYVPAGTLPRPRWLGRGLRLVLGAVILLSAFSVGVTFQYFENAQAIPDSIGLWVLVAVLFLSMRHEINLGLGVSWGRHAQLAIVVLAVLAIALDFILYGRVWASPLGILFYFWFLVSALPLGVALVLSSLLATPGCEMRSYAHLLARLQGRDASEHYCPGGIDIVDRWEARHC
ncbi:MAG: hypothetical protein P8186_02845 [Anaerolineae bacterium]|jgi:hypothetical protein